MSIEIFARQSLAQFVIIYAEIFDEKAIKPSELEALMWGKMCAKEAGIVKTGFKIPYDNIKRAKVTLPYMPDEINYTGCCAIKKNGGLYTPCCGKVAEDTYYCKSCSVKDGESKEIEFGAMDDRDQNVEDGRFAPITFAEWMKGHKTTLPEVYAKLRDAGIALEIPANELTCRELPKRRKGRPAKSDDSVVDEDTVPKKGKKGKASDSDDDAPKKTKAKKVKAPEPESESEEEAPKPKAKKAKSPEASEDEAPKPKAKKVKSPEASEDEAPKPKAKKAPEPEAPKPKAKKVKSEASEDEAPKAKKSPKASPAPSEDEAPKAKKSPKTSPAPSEDESPKKAPKAKKPKADEAPKSKAEPKKPKAEAPKESKKPKADEAPVKKAKVPEPVPEPETLEEEEAEEEEIEDQEISIDDKDYILRNGKFVIDKDDGRIVATVNEDGEPEWVEGEEP
jgi:hypothetical protein